MDKHKQYTGKILAQLEQLFDEKCDNHISVEELAEGDNANAFIHALATLAPGFIYSKLTAQNVDALEFNHIANNLVFQYTILEKE